MGKKSGLEPSFIHTTSILFEDSLPRVGTRKLLTGTLS